MLVGALLLTSVFVFAQRGNHPKPNPELKKEMRSYVEQEVVPVLQKTQAAFDRQLSAQDLAFLQAKRAEVAQAKEAMKTKHDEVRKLREQGMSKEEIHEQMKAQKPEMRAKKQAFAESMKPFLEQNASLITRTMASLDPSYENWIADQKSILTKYEVELPAKAEQEGRHGLFGLPMGPHHRKHGPGKKGQGVKAEAGAKESKERVLTKEQHQAMRFLLWDGEMPPAKEPRMGTRKQGPGAKGNQRVQGGTLQAAPNPVSGSTKLSFSLEAPASEATLAITTKEGALVRTLDLGAMAAGNNEYLLNVEDLSPGVYFYTLEAGTFRATKRLIVQ